ncbi:serine--tRNA ligase [Acidithrix ferrooxidans]|uniref:Serine--tRNA ligase n=1 Tax=Acidithrix ferrooxidans TaxID=1280514 RepID=A0A0D8HJ23_9ACTN|nr:serine--tRNA ligase [Acidithrix ferrooxidans]KJF17923.1 serine--tRNA ligase [Acidithrix ferrooxidans]
MIDIRALRENPNETKELLSRRGIDTAVVDELLEIDLRLRSSVSKRDSLRAVINDLSRSVAEAYRQKETALAQELKEKSKAHGEALEELSKEVSELENARRDLWLVIPNVPSLDTPIGQGEKDNVILRYWSPKTGHSTVEVDLDYEPAQKVPHWEIGAALGILDLERAAKLSGSMFPMYKGAGARMLRALTSFALDAHSDAFLEVRPPTFVKRETMVSTGHLPKFAEDAYQMERDDLWAIPTAEVPLTSMARDEILPSEELPIRMTAATPCFRREAGSAGRDTRGLLRLHEFDKVELMVYSNPKDSQGVFMDMLRRAEGILQSLGLTYRVLDLCTGDIGASAKRTFDLEAYSPGVGRWLEVSSVSWFGDYQARRANIRFRDASTNEVSYVDTLNGSALAWARVFAVLIETYRNQDESVTIPLVLVPYMGGIQNIVPK